MRLLNIREVLTKTSLSKRQVYRLVDDGTFPKPVKVGTRSAWVDTEIEDWIGAQVARRDELLAA